MNVTEQAVWIQGRRLSILRNGLDRHFGPVSWTLRCVIDGSEIGAEQFLSKVVGPEPLTLSDPKEIQVAFFAPHFGLVAGNAQCRYTAIGGGAIHLRLTGYSRLEQLSTLPDTLPADTRVAHETTVLKLETEVAAQARGLCPPGVDVEIRRTERVRGLEPGKLVIQMWVGGNPW